MKKVNAIIVVAALGYFVDIYDLILFNVVKKESLAALGFTSQNMGDVEISLFNLQMIGMLVGGLIWGILGDKRGRISVLFGSILMYSIANIANAFVDNSTTYGLWRFIAGVGLAGELGAGITLVAEVMHKDKRGYGTMIVVTFGALGAVVAVLVGNNGAVLIPFIESVTNIALQNWQVAYLIGGFLGVILLLLRLGVYESGMYNKLSKAAVSRGNFMLLVSKKSNLIKYVYCILIGLPIWYAVGILVNLSDRFITVNGYTAKDNISVAVMYVYIGLSAGDLLSGLLSQYFKSRKKVILGYILVMMMIVVYFLFIENMSAYAYKALCLALGISTGFWAIFVTNAAEQFGTNLRSTVTTTVPNFVRGATVPITLSFKWLSDYMSINYAALIVGVVCLGMAFVATLNVQETFGKDLDYYE